MGYISDGFGTQETIGGITLFESMRSNQLATSNYAGLMSPQDKAKLDGIESGANNYVHPDSGVLPGIYTQVEVDAQGHVVAGWKTTDGGTSTNAYIQGGTIFIGENQITPLTAESKLTMDNLPDDVKAFIEKFMDSIPFTQADKEKLDSSGSGGSSDSFCWFTKTATGNLVLKSLSTSVGNEEDCLFMKNADGNIILKDLGLSDDDAGDDSVIAASNDISQLVAKFTSPEKDTYDDVIAADSDTQQLIDKFK